MIEIYVDGSCRGNPGPGGWGAVVVENEKIISAHSMKDGWTTNNRMEMSAILWATAGYGDLNPIVYSDSAYAVNTFNTWMWNWKNNGWRRAMNQPIENLDLVRKYDELIQKGYKIDLRKVAGHSGVKYNEVADGLATGRLKPEEVMKLV